MQFNKILTYKGLQTTTSKKDNNPLYIYHFYDEVGLEEIKLFRKEPLDLIVGDFYSCYFEFNMLTKYLRFVGVENVK